MLESIFVIVVVLCLLGTVIWAADHYLVIPGPFAWVKEVLIFLMIVVACYFVYDLLLSHHLGRLHGL